MGKSNRDIAVILKKKHANICNQIERILRKTLKTVPDFVQKLPIRVGGGYEKPQTDEQMNCDIIEIFKDAQKIVSNEQLAKQDRLH